MKKLKLIYALITMLMLASCNAEESGFNDGVTILNDSGVSFSLGKVDNTGGNHFENKDKIGVQAYGPYGTLIGVSTYQLYNGLFSSYLPFQYPTSSNPMSFIAVYPDVCGDKSEFIATAGRDQSRDQVAKESDILIAKSTFSTERRPKLNFHHMMSNIIINVKVTRSGEPYPFKDVRFNAKLAQKCDIIEDEYSVDESAEVVEIMPNVFAESKRYSIIVASQTIVIDGFASLVTDVNHIDDVITMEDDIMEQIEIASGEQKIFNWEIELEPLSQKITELNSSIEGWYENDEITDGGVDKDLDGDIDGWDENEEIKNDTASPSVGEDIGDWGDGGEMNGSGSASAGTGTNPDTGDGDDDDDVVKVYDWNGIAVPVAAPTGQSWVLDEAASDDFNYEGKGAEFTAKWTDFYHNAWTGPAPTYWVRDHVTVSGGDLRIKASRPDNVQNLTVTSGGSSKDMPATYTGCITSTTRVSYPAYVEAYAQLSNSTMASDVWMLSPDDTQEIDIIEAYGGSRNTGYNSKQFYGQDYLHLSHHVFDRSTSTIKDYQPKGNETWYRNGTIWRNDYHRIGVYWKDATTLQYYIDGVLVRTTPANEIDPNNYTGGTGLVKDMDIIINMEDQSWRAYDGMSPTNAELQNEENCTFKVDWIRVYKLQ